VIFGAEGGRNQTQAGDNICYAAPPARSCQSLVQESDSSAGRIAQFCSGVVENWRARGDSNRVRCAVFLYPADRNGTAIDCVKSETRVDLRHDRSCASTWFGRGSQSVASTGTVEKIVPSFIPRNPLISIDSDERIQGNPRKSNSGFRLFS
jgi:hypothetical protein